MGCCLPRVPGAGRLREEGVNRGMDISGKIHRQDLQEQGVWGLKFLERGSAGVELEA